ncbi:MAG: hypothetical protein A07HN63_02520 [uncultured archaeon A07HN63]|nr:MAG: hypothetical protein A07HN63_02520 [uncultured archaeon A07HN63]
MLRRLPLATDEIGHILSNVEETAMQYSTWVIP